MDIMELGAGELVGGVAVLVTLGYLAAQVRSSARDQRVTAMHQATREIGSLNESVGDTSEKAELWLKGIDSFEALSIPERLRFSPANGHVFRTMEQMFYLQRDGAVDPEIWQGFMNQLRDICAYPGIQAWWVTRKNWYGEHYQTFVAEEMTAENQPLMYAESPSQERRPGAR